jgi:DNA-binding winged helix-turn-helix (wHTH) protein
VRLHFGDCLLDTAARELRRAGEVVPLKPQAFRLLEVLVVRRPGAVSHTELRGLLWPDMQTGGTSLARLVSDVRVAIGSNGTAASQSIRTVHRFGYAFSSHVEEEVLEQHFASTVCSIQWGQHLLPLMDGENVIGRSETATICVPSPEVSRRHARIVVDGHSATLEDLGSRNGTYLGEVRLDSSVTLRHRDRIGVGPALLIFYVAKSDETTEISESC